MSIATAAAATREASAGIASDLAQFASGLRADRLPARVRIRALHLMLDAAGIALASHRFDFARASLRGIEALSGLGAEPDEEAREVAEGTVIGHPRRLPFRDAALANGLLVHGLDYDDTHVPGILHATASAFPCVLALGERIGASGAEVLAAYVAAVEAGARISAVPRGGFHRQGFHPTGLVGAFGCALGAGRLLGLDSARLAAAQGIALSTASGSMEFLEEGAWTKRLHPGWAAVAGLTSAYLASEGFVAPTRPYEGRFGLYRSHLGPAAAEACDHSLAVAGLGEEWELDRVAVKPFPACHFLHGCADAAIEIARRHDLDPTQVAEVTALVPEETIATICEPVAGKLRPASDYEAKFSVQYAVAVSLSRRAFGLAELEDEVRTDDAILGLAKRVRYRPDPSSAFPRAYSGEVVVRTHDGRELRHREQINRGADERPLTNGEIAEKYMENARLTVDETQAAAIREAILGLYRCPDVRAAACVLRGAQAAPTGRTLRGAASHTNAAEAAAAPPARRKAGA